ncbi:MAG: hypothetical protein AB8I08_23865 [Sandaracinaceae bacterium]
MDRQAQLTTLAEQEKAEREGRRPFTLQGVSVRGGAQIALRSERDVAG